MYTLRDERDDNWYEGTIIGFRGKFIWGMGVMIKDLWQLL